MGSPMPQFIAQISHRAAVRYGEVPGFIGVREALDKPLPSIALRE
jgi:hypothetical protein